MFLIRRLRLNTKTTIKAKKETWNGLKFHELNQPGTYKMFLIPAINPQRGKDAFSLKEKDIFFLAWTTTPWTLPSNTALTVGKKIDYVLWRLTTNILLNLFMLFC